MGMWRKWACVLCICGSRVGTAWSFDQVIACPPTVCAVGSEYQIMVPVRKNSLMWCEIDGRKFYDESNGILRSDTTVHRIRVPQAVLDKARGYKLCCRVVTERKAYFSKTEPVVSRQYKFRPIAPDAESIRIYHLADAHSMIESPVKAAGYWGDKLDLLVMNGDMMEDCSRMELIAAPYQISGQVTGGEIPVICSRGNHDLRGVLAEHYADVTPTDNGNTYYSFRLGPIWGLVLDCGEDKMDDHKEYGYTVCCSEFRARQTEFLEKLVTQPETEFGADGVRFKVIINHVPFCVVYEPPFNIETDTYRKWCRLLREHVKPDVMLCGHEHQLRVIRPGGEGDDNGTPCPVVVGSKPDRRNKLFTGAALEWKKNGRVGVWFTDQDRKVVGQDQL
ncbi:MAG: metallophosphoesterase [Lentisphaeria bacterium]|nr:metallophosphoesterase [Lentisphaeria bacterium]